MAAIDAACGGEETTKRFGDKGAIATKPRLLEFCVLAVLRLRSVGAI
jgi:hypothetical protein